MIGELRNQLGGRCSVYTSDTRVRIEETDRTTYPDVTVVCGQRSVPPTDTDAITNPIVLVEVPSESTEAIDRGEKFAHVRLPSLREYVMVADDAPRIEVYRRDAEDRWVLSEFRRGETAVLESIEVRLDVDAVYFDTSA
ncbi:MAG: Uma2 family endonuclease [Sandaracinaceae bacterium]